MTGSQRRSLVLDANILIRAVLGSRVRDLISENAGHIQFFTPSVCVADARKYLPEILNARGVDASPAMALLDLLMGYVQVLEKDWLLDYETKAKARMEKRDLADWPVLAAALALGCPVWTQDTDFFGVGVATWTTQHVADYFVG